MGCMLEENEYIKMEKEKQSREKDSFRFDGSKDKNSGGNITKECKQITPSTPNNNATSDKCSVAPGRNMGIVARMTKREAHDMLDTVNYERSGENINS